MRHVGERVIEGGPETESGVCERERETATCVTCACRGDRTDDDQSTDSIPAKSESTT